MNGKSILILLIVVIVLIPALKSSLTHLKGESSCCGGPKEKVRKKTIRGKKLAEMILSVDGMHCSSCKVRIENHLNELEGIVAKVNLEKKQVTVSLYQDVSPNEIIKTIEDLDYHVNPS